MTQIDHLDAVIVPVGGGGLLAGICLAIKVNCGNGAILTSQKSLPTYLLCSTGSFVPSASLYFFISSFSTLPLLSSLTVYLHRIFLSVYGLLGPVQLHFV